MKKNLLVLFLIAFLLPFVPKSIAADSPSQIRGIWLTNVDSEILFKADELQRDIDQLAQFNFNTLYPTVWNWGYTLYPSAVAQKATGVCLNTFSSGIL